MPRATAAVPATHAPRYTLLLAALVTLGAFATDMGLPVLGQTAASFGITAGRAALTLSVFLAGYGIAPLVAGPLSDHRGRRPVLLAGCAVFAACGAFAAFARSFEALLLWRFLMGAGAGACQVLVVAMVRDLYVGTEARVRQSYVNLAAGVAPIIAPTLGAGIAALGGWRAIYGSLAVGGALLLAVGLRALVESAPRRPGAALTLRGVVRRYAHVLGHPVSLGYAVVVALNFGALFAYVSGSSLVLIGVLGVTPRTYGLLFACSALGLMTGALLSARLSRRGVAAHRLVQGGMAAIVGTALVLVAISAAGRLGVATMVPLAVLGFVGHGVVRPNAVQGALEPVPEMAGVASAVMSALQMAVGAAASATVALLFDGRSTLAMTGPMAACALASAGVYRLLVRPAEARRRPPADAGDAGAPRDGAPGARRVA